MMRLIVAPLLFGLMTIAWFLYVTSEQPGVRRKLRWFGIALAIGAALAAFALVATESLALQVALLVLVVGGGLYWPVIGFRADIAAHQRAGHELSPSDEPSPPAVEQQRTEMEGLGFQTLTVGRDFEGSLHVLLFHPSAHILGEAVQHAVFRTDEPVVELTSFLTARPGVLTTSNFGAVDPFWPGDLRQTFPSAGARQLLIEHERALEFLRAYDLGWQPVRAVEALDARRRCLAMEIAAALAAPRRQVLRILYGAAVPSGAPSPRVLRRLGRRQPASIGPLEKQPGIEQRIKALTNEASDGQRPEGRRP